jgi:hypothetical protein
MPGNALARSVEDLTAAESEGDLAISAADVIPSHVPDDAIDQLTADLAAFCFDRLEGSVMSGNEGPNQVTVAGANDVEDELQVRFKSYSVDNIPMVDSSDHGEHGGGGTCRQCTCNKRLGAALAPIGWTRNRGRTQIVCIRRLSDRQYQRLGHHRNHSILSQGCASEDAEAVQPCARDQDTFTA